jgi:hypothetical protein
VLAIILFGLIAFQAHVSNAAASGTFAANGTTSAESALAPGPAYGLNTAGFPMLFFGLLFAVLECVTGIAMAVQLTRASARLGQGAIGGLLQVEMAMAFLAMGLACRHANLGFPDGTDLYHKRITNAIEAFIIINWIITTAFAILTMLNLINWDRLDAQYDKFGRQSFITVLEFVTGLVLVGLFAGHFQFLTGGWTTETEAGVNGFTGTMLDIFGVMFAVLQVVTGWTMYQQMMRMAPVQNEETVSALLRITLAFGVIAFGFACRSIFVGLPADVTHFSRALMIAIQAFVIINFIVTLFVHLDVVTTPTYIWICEQEVCNGKPIVYGCLQLCFAIVLIGLLAAEMQNFTSQQHPDLGSVGLNGVAGFYMMLFGLIFAVLEAAAGFAMIERAFEFVRLRRPSANAVYVTNKVALAIGVLAMGFACRHIDLFLEDHRLGNPSATSIAIVHSIESFLIINFFLTWALQATSHLVDWEGKFLAMDRQIQPKYLEKQAAVV